MGRLPWRTTSPGSTRFFSRIATGSMPNADAMMSIWDSPAHAACGPPIDR